MPRGNNCPRSDRWVSREERFERRLGGGEVGVGGGLTEAAEGVCHRLGEQFLGGWARMLKERRSGRIQKLGKL